MLHKQLGNDKLITRFYLQSYDNGDFSWIALTAMSKDDFYITMLFILRESLRNSDSVLLRVRSKELRLYPQTP